MPSEHGQWSSIENENAFRNEMIRAASKVNIFGDGCCDKYADGQFYYIFFSPNRNWNDKNHFHFLFVCRLFSVFILIEQTASENEWDFYNGNANTAKVFVNYMQLGFAMDFSCLLHAVHFFVNVCVRKEWQLLWFSRLKTNERKKKR